MGSCYVPVVTLDAAIETFGRPWYCKVDVEGWELEVLKGLTRPLPLVSLEFHLTEKGIAATISCLERLSSFGQSQVNLTPAESSTFHLPEWMPLDRFLDWFPDDLERALPGHPYGDVFVRNTALVQAGSSS